MAFKVIFISAALFMFSFLSAQSLLNKPLINSDMPEWAKLLYTEPINLNELTEAYQNYYASHPFIKNNYTRYYKRLIMQNRMFTDIQGNIVNVNRDDWDLQIQKAKSSLHTRNKVQTWTVYPMETFFLENNNTACPWQVNVYGIDVCRSNSKIIIAAAETSGMYLTENGGQDWKQIGLNTSLGSEAIAIHPKNPDTLYVGTNSTIKRSADRGKTWETVYSFQDMYVYDLEIPLNHGHIILAATSKGLFRSDNGGKTWKQIFTDASCELKINPAKENMIYAMRYNPSLKNYEPWKSTNFGNTFVVKKTGWHNLADGGVRMAVSAADTKRIYAVALTNTNGPYLMRSNDEGETWNIQAQGSYENNPSTAFPMDNWQGYYDLSIVASQTNADHLITGTSSCFKSIDGGATFKIIGGYGGDFALHPDFQCSYSIGNETWIGTDGGLTLSTDFFTDVKNASAKNHGLNGSDFWGFDLGWNDKVFVGGRYHNGNTVYDENYNGKFIRMGGAESATGYVNPIKSNQVFYSDIGAYEIPSKIDSTWKWNSIPNKLWPNESYYPLEFSDMVWSPICYNTVYLGKANGFYKSENNGASYTLLFSTNDKNDVIEHIEICRSNPEVIYITSRNNSTYDGSVWKSTNGGKNFIALTQPSSTTGGERRVHTIAVSPINENIVFRALRTGGAKNKVFKSMDGGLSWINITSPEIANYSISDMCYQYGTDDGIYIACDGGLLFYRNNQNTVWSSYGDGLSVDHFTRGLRAFYRDGKLFTGSNMGVWDIPFIEDSKPLAQPTVDKLNSFCDRDTFYFEDYSVLKRDSAVKWKWEFTNAIYVSDNTISNPKVVFGKVGKYDVKLTVSNASGSDTKIIKNFIEVSPSQCSIDSTVDQVLDLSQRGDYATLNKIPELKNAKGFSCTAWIKLNSPQDCFTQILSNWNSNVGFGFGFAFQGYRTTTNLTFFWKNVPYQLTSPFYLDTLKWIHVGIVVYPDSVRLFRNGEYWTYKGNFKDFDFSTTPWEIGRGVPGQCGDFMGQLDELKIYNVSLSENEIRANMHLIHPEGENGLVSYYQFNENNNLIYNKTGAFHGSNAGGLRSPSTVPAGIGISQVKKLATGTNNFDQSNWSANINSVTNNSSNWYVYNIKAVTDSSISTKGKFEKSYWVVRPFGNIAKQNGTRLIITPSVSLSEYRYHPELFRLYKRTDPNEYLNNWKFIMNADSIDVVNSKLYFTVQEELSGQYSIEILDNPFVGTENEFSQEHLFIFPNPATHELNVQSNIIESGEILRICNLSGETIFSETLNSPFSRMISIKDFPNGIYFIRFGKHVEKFVKM